MKNLLLSHLSKYRRWLSLFLASAFMFTAAVPFAAPSEVQAAVTPNPNLLPMAMVFYGWHDAATNQRIVNARPQVLIDNTPAGFWGANCNSAYFQSQGIQVYSYIHASYSTFPLAQNLAYVDAIAAEGTYGVFLDECNPRADSYVRAIYERAKARGVKLIDRKSVV